MKPKLFLLIGDFSFNIALAHKLKKDFDLVGIVYERRSKKAITDFQLKKIIDKIVSKFLIQKLDKSWRNVQKYFASKYPDYPQVPSLYIENINSQETIDFYNVHPAQLILVSGTRLLKQNILNLKPKIGILNLHTGLSPYINGGPNCTNWCLSNNTIHLIGNTVMWIDSGIDSGNIVATRTVDFTGTENLDELHIKVFEASHQLYLDVIKCISESPGQLANIPQSSWTEGATYYNKMWTFSKKLNVVKNFRKFEKTVRSQEYLEKKKNLRIITLPNTK
jgi:methionyl-tRNA formyltransferase